MTDPSQIAARLAAASPGPWHVALGWDGVPYNAVNANGGLNTSICTILTPGVTPGGGYREPEGRKESNAEFIANAPSDIAYLLAQRDAVLALHHIAEDDFGKLCNECGETSWPCATVLAFGGGQ